MTVTANGNHIGEYSIYASLIPLVSQGFLRTIQSQLDEPRYRLLWLGQGGQGTAYILHH